MAMTLSSISFAAECVNEKGEDITSQPEVFQALIAKADSCYAAQNLAEACAYGSSLDVSTAGEAYQVCSAELAKNRPSKELSNTLKKMVSLCNKRYENEQGTMYRSFNAYCNLSAISWIVNLAAPNQ